MKPPKVSVLIPTYNYARYLGEAIESVLAQDFPDFELFISDDASTDASAAMIRDYAAHDRRIRWRLQAPRLGMVRNWNFCLKEARGEYIKFVFGDDKLARPEALGSFVNLMEQSDSVSLAVSARHIMDQNSRVTDTWDHLGGPGLHPGHEVILRCLAQNRNLIGEPSVTMFRRRDGGRGFDERLRQLTDMEMWFHLLENGNAAYTAEPLCCFRQHSRQQTEVNRVKRVGEREQLWILNEYCSRHYLKAWPGRKALFAQIYSLRKNGPADAEARELAARLLDSLGAGWYAGYWAVHKVVRPLVNLRRFWLKHILRSQPSTGVPVRIPEGPPSQSVASKIHNFSEGRSPNDAPAHGNGSFQ